MIDFGKIGTGNSSDTILPPREIFNALPNKKAEKFQYPRDVQSQVWAKWFDRRDESSLVVKMNTGSGKTAVGLLILKSCLNEGKFPAVYACPDKYLVKQVIDAAKELGIDVTEDPKSSRFQTGKEILVTNIYKIINGKSVFGVGTQGQKQNISSLIIDDAHACLEIIEDQFTMRIPRSSALYAEIYPYFSDTLNQQCQTKAYEIECGELSTYMHLPYWAWQENLENITKILVKNSGNEEILFEWPLLKEFLKVCSCVVGSEEIEISPHAIPLHVIPSLVNANRKIFMTATLSDNSILASHFSVNENSIKKPIVPESAGDIGDRMILLPQVINTDTTELDIKNYCKQISKDINVVIIVPSKYRANFWQEEADLILNASNLYEGVEQLKSGHVGLTILINKYDGIDLPGNACRLLIIDGFPDVRRKIDKIKQFSLSGSNAQVNQIVQKIEQGMGRGVRSNDDFCIVFLVGRELTNQLYAQGGISYLSPSTKAQLKLSEQVSEQIKDKHVSELTETINYCLSRGEEWVKASKGVLATLKYDEIGNADKVTLGLRKAYDYCLNSDIDKSTKEISKLVNSSNDDKVKGYLKQVLAEYTNIFDKHEAQKVQLSAISDNNNLLRPIEGTKYHKIKGDALDQAVACKNYLLKKNVPPMNIIIEVNGILEKLVFKIDTANQFEESFKNIAFFLGFDSQRPEQEYKKGPDVLWATGNLNYFVIECKNGASVVTITKEYCNQLNGSSFWFDEKYDSTCSYTPIMIHPAKNFEYACSPKSTIRIMDEDNLNKFRFAVRDFINSICSESSFNEETIRNKLIAYKLRGSDIVAAYTSKFKINS